MILKIDVRKPGNILSFDKETGELLIEVPDSGSKNNFPVNLHVARGSTEQDYRNTKDLQSATVRVGQNGGLQFVDRERGRR
jgi:hypothetical protein